MADEWSNIHARARLCPPCDGGCNENQGRGDCPARVPNPIDEAWQDGVQYGHDRGVSHGVVGAVVAALVVWLLGALLGVWA